jgi:hypothetical protein
MLVATVTTMAAPTVASVLACILVISLSLLIGLDGTLTVDDSHKQPGVQRLPDGAVATFPGASRASNHACRNVV